MWFNEPMWLKCDVCLLAMRVAALGPEAVERIIKTIAVFDDFFHRTARVNYAARRRGGGVAARGARAATGHAGNRVHERWLARSGGTLVGCISARLKRNRLHREP